MQQQVCGNNCQVKNLSELWVCTLEDCQVPKIRCENCFSYFHVSLDDQGKKRTHPNVKLDESSLFKSLLFLFKIYDVIVAKFIQTFGKINQNVDALAFQIFSSSDFATKIFRDQQTLSDFYILRQLYKNKQPKFYSSPSAQLYETILFFTEKGFSSVRNLLLMPSEQNQLMTYFFNNIVQSGPQQLQAFILLEQNQFIAYCDEVRQKNQGFDIKKYLAKRREAYGAGHMYFTAVFQNFMVGKYGERPQEQQIFTPSEYLFNVWDNFEILTKVQVVQEYLDRWVQSFKQFLEYFKTQNLEPTLLSFRLWKHQSPSADDFVRQRYFLQNFVLSFIDSQLTNQVNTSQIKNWKDFTRYLADFVIYCKSTNQQFLDIKKYAAYFEFRQKYEPFVEQLIKSQDVTFSRQCCVQYLNNAYKDSAQISKKNYKKMVESKIQLDEKKQRDLIEANQRLNKQLEEQQGQKFYQILYNNFLTDCLQTKTLPTKQNYKLFRKDYLESVDEQGLRFENDKYLHLQKQQQNPQTQTKTQTKTQQKNQKVKYQVDETEQQLADVEDGDIGQEDCECCGGNPDECEQQQCKLVGYCLECSQ